MNKKEFVNKYSVGNDRKYTDVRKVMMVDLTILINKIVEEKVNEAKLKHFNI